MIVKFVGQNANPEIGKAVKSYSKIWEKEGERIVQVVESTSRLKFTSRKIEAEVYEGISQSHPLRLRSSYTDQQKKSSLVHELSHLLLE